MPSQQTSVSSSLVRGFDGQMYSNSDDYDTDSVVNEEASAELPFGTMVARGSTDPDEGALAPHTSAAAMADAFIGVVLHSHSYGTDEELGDTGLKPTITMSILKKGRVWVTPEDAVTANTSAVRVRVLTAGMEVAGAFRAAADASDCVDISAFAHWVTSAGAGQPAVLEIDMTSPAGTAD